MKMIYGKTIQNFILEFKINETLILNWYIMEPKNVRAWKAGAAGARFPPCFL